MRRKYPPQFHYLTARSRCITNPSRTLAPQQTLFGLSVTEAVLSAAQADTLHSLASGFAQSEPCDRSSQSSVAGRHLHHMRFELHGISCLHAEWPPPHFTGKYVQDKHVCAHACMHNINHRVLLVNYPLFAVCFACLEGSRQSTTPCKASFI